MYIGIPHAQGHNKQEAQEDQHQAPNNSYNSDRSKGSTHSWLEPRVLNLPTHPRVINGTNSDAQVTTQPLIIVCNSKNYLDLECLHIRRQDLREHLEKKHHTHFNHDRNLRML